MAQLSKAKRKQARTRRQNSLLHRRLQAMQGLAVRYYREAHPEPSPSVDIAIPDVPLVHGATSSMQTIGYVDASSSFGLDDYNNLESI